MRRDVLLMAREGSLRPLGPLGLEKKGDVRDDEMKPTKEASGMLNPWTWVLVLVAISVHPFAAQAEDSVKGCSDYAAAALAKPGEECPLIAGGVKVDALTEVKLKAGVALERSIRRRLLATIKKAARSYYQTKSLRGYKFKISSYFKCARQVRSRGKTYYLVASEWFTDEDREDPKHMTREEENCAFSGSWDQIVSVVPRGKRRAVAWFKVRAPSVPGPCGWQGSAYDGGHVHVLKGRATRLLVFRTDRSTRIELEVRDLARGKARKLRGVPWTYLDGVDTPTEHVITGKADTWVYLCDESAPEKPPLKTYRLGRRGLEQVGRTGASATSK